MKRLIAGLVMGCIALPVGAQLTSEVDFERVLLPVAITSRPGAFGAVWGSEIAVRNEADVAVDIFRSDCAYFCQCVVQITCAGPQKTPAHGDFRGAVSGPTGRSLNTGGFIYLDRRFSSDIGINARLVNFTRLDDNLGTEIPVVREHDFRTSTTWLVNVPMNATARQHLRLFAVPRPDVTESVRIRVWNMASNELLGERTLELRDADLDALLRSYRFPSEPDFGEIGNLAQVFSLAPRVERVRIELQPLSAGMQFWAFVSATDNTTQHVTIVTPQ